MILFTSVATFPWDHILCGDFWHTVVGVFVILVIHIWSGIAESNHTEENGKEKNQDKVEKKEGLKVNYNIGKHVNNGTKAFKNS